MPWQHFRARGRVKGLGLGVCQRFQADVTGLAKKRSRTELLSFTSFTREGGGLENVCSPKWIAAAEGPLPAINPKAPHLSKK